MGTAAQNRDKLTMAAPVDVPSAGFASKVVMLTTELQRDFVVVVRALSMTPGVACEAGSGDAPASLRIVLCHTVTCW